MTTIREEDIVADSTEELEELVDVEEFVRILADEEEALSPTLDTPPPTAQEAQHAPPVQEAQHAPPVQEAQHAPPVQEAQHAPPVQEAQHAPQPPVQEPHQPTVQKGYIPLKLGAGMADFYSTHRDKIMVLKEVYDIYF
jgi:hypothetical protein